MAARSARALVVELVADVADFVKGTQKADTALGDFVTEAESDLDRVERATKDMADDAERHFENLAREAKKSFRKIGTDGAREVSGADTKERFGEAGSEVGAEFASNLGESLSSGDLTSVAADTAGGLVSAFQSIGGPIGIGLAAAAAGATMIFQKIQADAEARAARIKEVTASIFDELSGDFQEALGEITRGSAYQSFIQGFSKNGDLGEGLREMGKLANTAGIKVGDIADAFINGGPAAEALRARLVKIKADGTTISANAKGQQTSMTSSAKSAATLAARMGEADTATRNAAQEAELLKTNMFGATAQARLLEAAASRTSSAMSSAAAASARIRGPAGTVVGGRTIL